MCRENWWPPLWVPAPWYENAANCKVKSNYLLKVSRKLSQQIFKSSRKKAFNLFQKRTSLVRCSSRHRVPGERKRQQTKITNRYAGIVPPQNCRHCWPAVQTLEKIRKIDSRREKKNTFPLLCLLFHLWKTNRGLLPSAGAERGRIPLLKLQISPTVELLREIMVSVCEGREWKQSARKTERISDGERERERERGERRGLAEKVHLKQICYSKKERMQTS